MPGGVAGVPPKMGAPYADCALAAACGSGLGRSSQTLFVSKPHDFFGIDSEARFLRVAVKQALNQAE
jgi:hypothetical protein